MNYFFQLWIKVVPATIAILYLNETWKASSACHNSSLCPDSVSVTFIDSRHREGEAQAPGPAAMDLMPKSPGISKNQNLKDQVLQDVFNRKIRDLKRMQTDKLSVLIANKFIWIELIIPLSRRERTCSEEDVHQMGQLTPDADQLPCQWSLHRSQGWQAAHQTSWDLIWR